MPGFIGLINFGEGNSLLIRPKSISIINARQYLTLGSSSQAADYCLGKKDSKTGKRAN